MPLKATAILLLLTASCATTSNSSTEPEQASCDQMEQGMGLSTPHDHTAMKGAGQNPMNLTHERCVQILRKPSG
jgi:hypothetical protein